MNLTIDNVSKCFGSKKALDINRYSIYSGQLVGLVGNNGAGKTTLFRIILDLLKADTGSPRKMPSMVTWPVSALSRSRMMRNSVVLPAPLLPTSPTSWPLYIE